MVNGYGQWIEEQNYKEYPEENWCDFDYMANWIRNECRYTPETEMENLISNVLAAYAEELEDSGLTYYCYPTHSLMVNVDDVKEYVRDCGGLREFDY